MGCKVSKILITSKCRHKLKIFKFATLCTPPFFFFFLLQPSIIRFDMAIGMRMCIKRCLKGAADIDMNVIRGMDTDVNMNILRIYLYVHIGE